MEYDINKRITKQVLKNKEPGTSGTYGCRWDILDSDMKVLISRKGRMDCWANLPLDVADKSKKVSFIRLYTCKRAAKVSLDEEACFLNMCRRNGALIRRGGPDMDGMAIIEDGLLLPVSHPGMTVDRLYIACCLIRACCEYPNFPLNILHLVDYCGVPFWVAVWFAHIHNVTSSGHSFFGHCSSPYYSTPGSSPSSTDGLRKWVEQQEKKEGVLQHVSEYIKKGIPWSWYGTAAAITPKDKGNALSSHLKFIYPNIVDVLRATNAAEIKAAITTLEATKHD